MIKFNDTYGIEVDSRCFITGKIGFDAKKQKDILLNPRYFTSVTQAIKDIADRQTKGTLCNVDCDLMEAVTIIKNVYSEFESKLDEINKQLGGA